MKLALCVTGLLVFLAPAAASAFNLSSKDTAAVAQPLQIRTKRKVIDKSCLMICEKWGENDCEKWVMKCKGDRGYPTGLLLRQ